VYAIQLLDRYRCVTDIFLNEIFWHITYRSFRIIQKWLLVVNWERSWSLKKNLVDVRTTFYSSAQQQDGNDEVKAKKSSLYIDIIYVIGTKNYFIR